MYPRAQSFPIIVEINGKKFPLQINFLSLNNEPIAANVSHMTREWQSLSDAPIIALNTIRPATLSLNPESSWTKLAESAITHTLKEASMVDRTLHFRPAYISIEKGAEGRYFYNQLDTDARQQFWSKHKVTSGAANPKVALPNAVTSVFEVSALTRISNRIISLWEFSRAYLPYLMTSIRLGTNLYNEAQKDHPDWFERGLRSFMTDLAVQGPFRFALGGTFMPISLGSLLHGPLHTLREGEKQALQELYQQPQCDKRDILIYTTEQRLEDTSVTYCITFTMNLAMTPLKMLTDHLFQFANERADQVHAEYNAWLNTKEAKLLDEEALNHRRDMRDEQLSPLVLLTYAFGKCGAQLIDKVNEFVFTPTGDAEYKFKAIPMGAVGIQQDVPKKPENKFGLPEFNPALIKKNDALQSGSEKKVKTSVHNSSPVPSVKSSLPEFTYKPAIPTPTDKTTLPTFSSSLSILKNQPVVNTETRGQIATPSSSLAVSPSSQTMAAPEPIKLQNIRFGAMGNGVFGIVADYTGGEVGNWIGTGIKISQGSIAIMASSQVELGAGFVNALRTMTGVAWPYALPVAVVAAVFHFYQCNQQRKAKKTSRHLKRHVEETQQHMQEFISHFNTKLSELTTLMQQDFNKFQRQMVSDLNKSLLKVRKLDHKISYAYKHSSHATANGIAQSKYILKQTIKDKKWELKNAKRLIKARKDAKILYQGKTLAEMLERFQQLTNGDKNKILTQAQHLEAEGLRDVMIDRALAEGNYQLLLDNPLLLAPHVAISYDIRPVANQDKLRPRAIDAKHGTRGDKCDKADAIITTLENSFEAIREMLKNDAINLEKAIDDFLHLADATIESLNSIKLEKDNKNSNSSDYYIKKIQRMVAPIKTIKNKEDNLVNFEITSRYDLDAIFTGLKFDEDHKNDSATDLVKLGQDLVANKNLNNTEMAKWTALSNLIINKLAKFSIAKQYSEAEELLESTGTLKATPKRTEKDTLADVPIIEAALGKKWEDHLWFMQEHQNEDANFWLNVLDDLPQADETNSKGEGEALLDAVKHHAAVQGCINSCTKDASLGYNRHAAITLRKLSQRDTLDWQPSINKLEFSHDGQLIGSVVGSIQGMIAREVAVWQPSAKKTVMTYALNALDLTQIFVPSFVTLSVQGMHAGLTGNTVTFFSHFDTLKTDLKTSLKAPHKHFNGALIYGQLGLHLMKALPIENWVPARFQESFGKTRDQVIRYGSSALDVATTSQTVMALVQSGFKHANTGVFLAQISKTVMKYGVEAYNTYYLASRGKAIENINVYRVIDGTGSLMDVLGWSALTVAITGGFSLVPLAAVTTVSTIAGIHNVMCTYSREKNAAIILKNCMTNINYFNRKIADKNISLLENAMYRNELEKSLDHMTDMLYQMFDGFDDIEFNEEQHPEVKAARELCIYLFLHRVHSFFEEKKFTDVLELTKRSAMTVANRNIVCVGNAFRIPVYLAWDAIYLRLAVMSSQAEYIANFRNEFQTYSEDVAHAPANWRKLHEDDVKKKMVEIVKFSLAQLLEAAVNTQTDVKVVKALFESIVSTYRYCPDWHTLLNNQSKFLAATLSYNLNLTHLCTLFLKHVDLKELTRDIPAQFFDASHMFMLKEIQKLDFTHLLTESDMVGNKISNSELLRMVSALSAKKEYKQALEVAKLIPDTTNGKYYAYAVAYYGASNDQAVPEVLDLLFKEKQRNLSYWLLMNHLIQRCLAVVKYIPDSVKRNDSWMKLLLLLRVIGDYIQREKIDTDLQRDVQQGIDNANVQLSALVSAQHSIKSITPLTSAEQQVRVEKMVEEAHRCTRGDTEINFRTEVQHILGKLTYRYIAPNIGSKYYFVVNSSKPEDSIFGLFNVTRADAIVRLSAAGVVTSQYLTSIQASAHAISLDENGKSLIDCLASFFEKNILILKLNAKGNLTIAHQKHHRPGSGILEMMWTGNEFVLLQPAKVQCEELPPVLKLPALSFTDRETKAEQYYERNKSITVATPIADALAAYSIGQHKHYTEKDLSAASICYQQALKLDPEYADANFGMGCLYEANSEFEPAKSHWQKAAAKGHVPAKKRLLAMPMKTAEEWNKLGDEYYFSKNHPEDLVAARSCYELATEKDPKNYDAIYSLGVTARTLYQ